MRGFFRPMMAAAMIALAAPAGHVGVRNDIQPTVEAQKPQRKGKGRGKATARDWRDRNKYSGAQLRDIRMKNGVGWVTNPGAAQNMQRMFKLWHDKKFGDMTESSA